MTRQQHEPIWPFLCVLSLLFALSVTTPRSWQRSYEKAPWELAERKACDARTVVAASPGQEGAVADGDIAEVSSAAVAMVLPTAATAEISLPDFAGYEPAETAARIAALIGQPEVSAEPQAVAAAEPAVEVSLPDTPAVEAAPASGLAMPAPEPADLEPSPEEPPIVVPAPVEVAADDASEPQEDAESPEISLAETPATESAVDDGAWPEPRSLLARLDEAAQSAVLGPWAGEAARLVRALGTAVASQQSADAQQLVRQLHAHGRKADALALQLGATAEAGDLRRLQHGLARRLDVWWRVLPLVSVDRSTLRWTDLLRHIEQYESQGTRTDAARLVADLRQLSASPTVECRQIAERLEIHYCNANVRLTVSQDLLNRFMPERAPEYQWVCDRVLGKPVRGSSVTMSKLGVRLIPDSSRWRLALDIEGLVTANTWSESGPATFWSDSASAYRAWKEVELRLDGVRAQPVQLRVANETQLRAVRTDLDPIPVIGALANGVARSQYDQRQPQARAEVEYKVAHRAGIQIDREAKMRLEDLNGRLEQRLLGPLSNLGIEPVVLESQTSAERLTARLRLAAADQLGANTPRPQAPAGSLASVQIHESAINNLLAGLELDGQVLSIPELRQRIAERVGRPEIAQRTSESDDVVVGFADREAVAVHCQDGEVHVVLAIKVLVKPPRRWTDFRLRARYKPQIRGLNAELVREGVVELSGPRLSTRSQIPLRSVASKIFSPDQPLRLTPEEMQDDARFSQVSITQFVIADGWLGMACGAAPAGSIAMASRGVDAE